jgi:tetratricopeptide (TPR) repeat protein
LIEAGIPPRRVRRLWSSLRRQLAADLPLTSVRILADGERAIAWDENASWQPDSGQFLLDFDAGEIAERAGEDIEAWGTLKTHPMAETAEAPNRRAAATPTPSPAPHPSAAPTPSQASHPSAAPNPTAAVQAPAPSAEQWFHLACELEDTSPLEARQAYIQCLALDPDFADAHINLGRLAHDAGELGRAEAHYRSAVQCAPEDAIGHFNLGVLLEDRGRPDEAIHAYEQAIARDPDAADAYYNLGVLLESRGRRSEAMRHLMTARRLYAQMSPA